MPLIILIFFARNPFAQERHEQRVEDLAYGLSLFQFFQDKTLPAITELEVGQFRNSLINQPADAELLLGGLYFLYGLPTDAELIFNRLLGKDENDNTRNRIWFNLALVQYERGNYAQAAELLSRIDEPLSTHTEARKLYILTRLYLDNSQFDLAEESARQIPRDSVWYRYAIYNIAVAFMAMNRVSSSETWLKDLTLLEADDDERKALQDATFLALGLSALRQKNSEQAINWFNKVRLSGPLSNKALLGAGWAWSNKPDTDKALSHFLELRNNGHVDGASLEAVLAIPMVIEQKGDKVIASQYYDRAAKSYDQRIHEMDVLIDEIKQGFLLIAIQENSFGQSDLANRSGEIPGNANISRYLHSFYADQSVQAAIREYRELLAMYSILSDWQNTIPVLELMLTERRLSFENKRPRIEKSTRFDELKQIQLQRDELADRVIKIEQNEKYLDLANADEGASLAKLEKVKLVMEKYSGEQDFSVEQDKHRFLYGLLYWQIRTEFPRRFWLLKRELELLDRELKKAAKASQSLSQAAAQNDVRLGELKERIVGQNEIISQQLKKTGVLIDKQEQHINRLAIATIESQKRHIAQLRLNARYSFTRLYDELSSTEAVQ